MRPRDQAIIGGILSLSAIMSLLYYVLIGWELDRQSLILVEMYGASALSIGILLIISACSCHFRHEGGELSFRLPKLLMKTGKGAACNDNAIMRPSRETFRGGVNTQGQGVETRSL
jgi:hypothetical protein